jgi:radical SAM protein with 4Fe4S-binding SPASM domain
MDRRDPLHSVRYDLLETHLALRGRGKTVMKFTTLARLGWKHVQNALAEAIYIKTGHDATKPTSFYAEFTSRCNSKCRYCGNWRPKEHTAHMTIDEWKRGFLSIKDFVGKYSISLSGGEPFIKPGFIDLLVWCSANGISAGVTTNGTALTQRNVQRLVAAKPLNVNISVDTPNVEVNDYLRGYPGHFKRVSTGLKYLVEERARQGATFPIIIKPVLTALNFRDMPDLVEWTKAMGASCVYAQPVIRMTPETYDELWIKEPELPELERMVQHLIEMRRAGEPILTSELVLSLMPDHFRQKKAPAEAMPCLVGLRNFSIAASGDVYVCNHFFPAIGNLKTQTVREIWYGAKAREVRKQTVACQRLCLGSCVSQKALMDKIKMGFLLLKNAQLKPASGKKVHPVAQRESSFSVPKGNMK